MGKLSRGFLGGFQGQLGTAYGCFWRLMDLVKAMPRKVKRAATDAQMEPRLRLALMTGLLSKISTIIKIGFKGMVQAGQSPMNAGVSYNIKNAITGVFPEYKVDFSKLMFGKGKLFPSYGFDVTADMLGNIKFQWSMASMGTEDGKPTDTCVFIVFNPVRGRFLSLNSPILRSALQYDLAVPVEFSGETVQCYMMFISENRKLVSDSTYIGALILV